jgi:mannose-1-phosphate guanylyltransferase
MIQVTPVTLCCGSGTPLWPLSHTCCPKQFLCLTGNENLFQQASVKARRTKVNRIQVKPKASQSLQKHHQSAEH